MARARQQVVNATSTESMPSTARKIAPAGTPDVRFQPPPLEGHLLSEALSASKESRRRPRSRSGDPPHDGGARDAERINIGMLRQGWALLVFSVTAFVVLFWSIAVAPFVDTEGIVVLDALAKDQHYKYLVVFLIPVTLYAVIINWWGLKIFRHA